MNFKPKLYLRAPLRKTNKTDNNNDNNNNNINNNNNNNSRKLLATCLMRGSNKVKYWLEMSHELQETYKLIYIH